MIKAIEEPVAIERLEFDKSNPRYAPYHELGDDPTDQEIVKHLALTADLKELVQSIVANGYIKVEPLIVLKSPNRGKYIVLEGNRRLAALKLLNDKDFAKQCEITNLPELSSDKRDTIKDVYVTEVTRREDARALIGFKHINGPQRWDSFAKAKFAKEWFVSTASDGVKLKHIADSLGDGHSTIKRLVFGIFVLEQAQSLNIFDIEDRYNGKRIFPFSHLYTALSKSGFQKFLGIESQWKQEEPVEEPIKKDHHAQLKQVLLWLYGSMSEEIPPVIESQNPDLRKLNEILLNPKALRTLTISKNLSTAYEDVLPPAQLFENALFASHKAAEEALKRLSAYKGEEEVLLDVSETLLKNSKIIHTHMTALNKK